MSCQGTVKSFNGSKGFGFIVLDGEDVFVHIKDCADGGVPQVGDVMMFELQDNPSKPGSKKAIQCHGGTGTMADMKGQGKGKGGAQGTGAYTGTVKSFNGQKAWGFINHEGTDVFFHLKDMADGSAGQAGDQVRFDLEENPQKPGSMKAKNVTGGTGWPEAPKGMDKGYDKGKGKGKDYGPMYGGGGGWGGKGDPYGGGGWGGGDPYGPYGGGKDKGWGKDPWGGKGDGWGGKDPWGGKGGDPWGMGDGGWGKGKAKGGW